MIYKGGNFLGGLANKDFLFCSCLICFLFTSYSDVFPFYFWFVSYQLPTYFPYLLFISYILFIFMHVLLIPIHFLFIAFSVLSFPFGSPIKGRPQEPVKVINGGVVGKVWGLDASSFPFNSL